MPQLYIIIDHASKNEEILLIHESMNPNPQKKWLNDGN